MFGTLRYDSRNDNTEFFDRTYSFLSDGQGGPPHSACDLCRAKKLRCSGNKEGCDRCKATSSTCMYPSSLDDGMNKRRRRLDDSARKARLQNSSSTTSSQKSQGTRPRKQSIATMPTPPTSQNKPVQATTNAVADSESGINSEGNGPHDQEAVQVLSDDFEVGDFATFGDISGYPIQTPKSLDDTDTVVGLEFACETGLGTHYAAPATTQGASWPTPTPQSASSISNIEDNNYFARSPSPVALSLQDNTRRRSAAMITPPLNNLPLMAPQCGCLTTVVSMLEDLGNIKSSAPLDSVLATHKEYVSKCATVLACYLCMSKSESVMLLLLVYERLVAFCEELADAYLKGQTEFRESDWSRSEGSKRQLLIGKYRADSEGEWQSLLGALTLYQVMALGRQMLSLRKPASVLLRGGQISKCLACENKLKAIVEKLNGI